MVSALIKDQIKTAYPECNTAAQYMEIRKEVRSKGGLGALRTELEKEGYVHDRKLTPAKNIFAKVMMGQVTQEGMDKETANLGAASKLFMIASNRPEFDKQWASKDPALVGKVSMGERHRFMLLRDLSWDTFNVLAFGLDGGRSLDMAIEMLELMETAARTYASKTAGWSSNVGMYFHVYGHNSVNALHLHLVDLANTGPTFDEMKKKNLSLQDVLTALRIERFMAKGNVRTVEQLVAQSKMRQGSLQDVLTALRIERFMAQSKMRTVEQLVAQSKMRQGC